MSAGLGRGGGGVRGGRERKSEKEGEREGELLKEGSRGREMEAEGGKGRERKAGQEGELIKGRRGRESKEMEMESRS